MHPRLLSILLNLGHTLDHLVLLIFAAAVATIAAELGVDRWEDLMPYGAPAFFFFGLGSLPAGKLGDLWGRRQMMLLYFIGMGVSSLLVSQAQNPLQLSLLLALMGCFASIYHPVGIPMLIQQSKMPGRAIGINGMMGNLGIAMAALLTGWVVKDYGWRAAFWIPGVMSLCLGFVFWRVSPAHELSPAEKNARHSFASQEDKFKLFFVMTLAATTGSFLFNFTTNGNNEILFSKLGDELRDPAVIGTLLAAIYFIASFSQLIIGNLIDRVPLKKLYSRVIFLQLLAILAATQLDGWSFYFAQLIFMCAIFAAIPFTDAMIARYVADSMRSRFSGARLAISFGVSSIAVWLIGPIVKEWGFSAFLWLMAATSAATYVVIRFLPEAIDR
jgi:MFS family permease